MLLNMNSLSFYVSKETQSTIFAYSTEIKSLLQSIVSHILIVLTLRAFTDANGKTPWGVKFAGDGFQWGQTKVFNSAVCRRHFKEKGFLWIFSTYFETNICSLFLIHVIESFGISLVVVLFMWWPENPGWKVGHSFQMGVACSETRSRDKIFRILFPPPISA